MGEPRLILCYNSMWGELPSGAASSLPAPFVLSCDRGLMSRACAVIFHLPTLSRYELFFRRLRKRAGQIWVAWSMECEANYPCMNDPSFMSCFDLRMTYHQDADVVVPYLDAEIAERLRAPAQDKPAGNVACAFISSPFNKSGRRQYLQELMRHLDVHSYGRQLRTRRIEEDRGRSTKLETFAAYRFTLAFENAIGREYITEKFFDPLLAGSVPVYLGAPNIGDFAPGDHCFINVADWESPRALAGYLHDVAADDELYQQYFSWKTQPFRPEFTRLVAHQQKPALNRLCDRLRDRL